MTRVKNRLKGNLNVEEKWGVLVLFEDSSLDRGDPKLPFLFYFRISGGPNLDF